MRSFSFLAVAIALATTSTLPVFAQQQLCNGYAELCAKTYDKVAYATTHNAFASTPKALAANQENDIPTQLKDGVRAFMLDAYRPPSGASNDIQLCHTSCDVLNAGTLTKTLGQVKAFLDANPNEVITIFWENAQELPASQFQAAYTAAGLASYLHTQPSGSTTWPTLAAMISSKKRIVNFIDSGADASVPWLMNEYDYVFETPYAITRGAEYPCTIDRPKGDLPQPGAAAQTNGPDLVGHINKCQSTFSQNPTFVAVDFYQKGSLLELVAQLNGVEYNGKGATQVSPTGKNAGNQVQATLVAGGALAVLTGFLTI
ncbi:hypothetical protein BGZ94_003811 [Podila epigama]|nr:hypothetical protein BGZ94_003811 [Podila epigama]